MEFVYISFRDSSLLVIEFSIWQWNQFIYCLLNLFQNEKKMFFLVLILMY